MTAVLYWRRPDAFYNPQLWAEDGNIFFNDIQALGLRALLIPYAGYFHTGARLVTLLTSMAAPADVPRAYALASWLLLVAVVALLFTPRLRFPTGVKLAMGLALVMTPVDNEVFFNLANWPFITSLFWLLLATAEVPRSNVARAFDIVCLTLAGLSSPFTVVLSPLFVARYLRDRSRFNLAMLGLAGATAIIQLQNMLSRAASEAPPTVGTVPVQGFLARIAYAFLGEYTSGLAPLSTLAIAAGLAIVIAGFGWLVWRALSTKQWQVVCFLGAAIASALLSTYVNRGSASIDDNLSGRHFYVFAVPLVWGLLFSATPWRWTPVAAILAAFLLFTPNSKNEILPNLDWAGQVARCVGVARICRIPINPVWSPPFWFAQFKPRLYAVPEMQTRFSARFGTSIDLLGYSESREHGALTYTLVWQAREKLGQDYGVFVHIARLGMLDEIIVDPSSRNEPTKTASLIPLKKIDVFLPLVQRGPPQTQRQANLRPFFWPYPDAHWERGEIVNDPIALPLDGLTPGEYAAWVQWRVNREPGLPLPAFDAAGQPLPDGWVRLPTTIVVP